MTSAPEWTDPGAHPVADGIYRIPLPMPNDGLRAVNVYAIEDDPGDGRGGLVLIDGGWDVTEARAALTSALAELGYGLADVRGVLATHVHRDHYTLGVALREEYGCPVTLGAGEHDSLAIMLAQTGDLMGELTRWDAEKLAEHAPRYDPEVLASYDWPDRWIDRAGEIELHTRVLRAVPTPGHTQGHLVFCDERAGLMFTGDHVLPHITPSIGFEPAMAASPLGDFLDSLALLRHYPDMRVLPAHGPVAESVHARVAELEAHHDKRLAATADAVRGGARTVSEIAGQLGWTRSERAFTELSGFNQFLAVTETAAHLQLLVARGELRVAAHGGTDYYAAPGDAPSG